METSQFRVFEYTLENDQWNELKIPVMMEKLVKHLIPPILLLALVTLMWCLNVRASGPDPEVSLRGRKGLELKR